MLQILIPYYHFHSKKPNHSYEVRLTFKIAQIISKWTETVLWEKKIKPFLLAKGSGPPYTPTVAFCSRLDPT